MTRITDALELLTAQHDELVELVATAQRDPGVLGELADKLSSHLAVEQEILYPSLAAAPQNEEHEALLTALADVLASPPATLNARLAVLADRLELHVAREDELYIAMSEMLPDAVFAELGAQLIAWNDRSLCIAA